MIRSKKASSISGRERCEGTQPEERKGWEYKMPALQGEHRLTKSKLSEVWVSMYHESSARSFIFSWCWPVLHDYSGRTKRGAGKAQKRGINVSRDTRQKKKRGVVWALTVTSCLQTIPDGEAIQT